MTMGAFTDEIHAKGKGSDEISAEAFRKTYPSSSKCEELGLELFLGDICTHNLILYLSVLEKQEQGDGTDIVFNGQLARIVHVDLDHLCLTFDLTGELVENGTDHFTGTAPLGPEID
jgi:hypothetical protein